MTYGLDAIAPFKSSRRHESGEAAAGPSASIIFPFQPAGPRRGFSLSLFPQIFDAGVLRIGKRVASPFFRVSAQNRRHGLPAGWFVVAVPDAGYRR